MSVYFIRAKGTDLFKIGYTDQSIAKRLKQLQVACPYELELFGTVAHGTRELEAELQRSLADWNTTGEWYAISEARAEALVNESDGVTARLWALFDYDPVGQIWVRMSDRKLFIPISVMSDWEGLVYVATSSDVSHSPHEDILIPLDEIAHDYPVHSVVSEQVDRLRRVLLASLEAALSEGDIGPASD
jgi:hypothetical protein